MLSNAGRRDADGYTQSHGFQRGMSRRQPFLDCRYIVSQSGPVFGACLRDAFTRSVWQHCKPRRRPPNRSRWSHLFFSIGEKRERTPMVGEGLAPGGRSSRSSTLVDATAESRSVDRFLRDVIGGQWGARRRCTKGGTAGGVLALPASRLPQAAAVAAGRCEISARPSSIQETRSAEKAPFAV
ncbi:hypothetical protein MRX96_038951 [Rhipicephalus microplus]